MRRANWRERDLVGDTSEHESATRIWLASAAKTALQSRPLLLATGLMASVVPCLTRTAALFLALPVAYVVRFAVALFDARSRYSAFRLARQLPIELPAPMSFPDGAAKHFIERLGRARRATESAVLYGPVGLAFDVSTLIDRVPQLERDVVVLAVRVDYLKRFLDSEMMAVVRANGGRSDADHGGLACACPTSEQFDRVIVHGPAHLALLTRLTNRMNEAIGMADTVLKTLEQIPAKIVSLQLTRIESCDGRSADACKDAATIIESFRRLEHAISDLAATEASIQ